MKTSIVNLFGYVGTPLLIALVILLSGGVERPPKPEVWPNGTPVNRLDPSPPTRISEGGAGGLNCPCHRDRVYANFDGGDFQ